MSETTGSGKVGGTVAATSALPVITNWQDVTERTREQARATQGLAVEAGAIRRTSSTWPPSLAITPDGMRDYAVRVRYTGEVQIGLRANKKNTDYLFVFCDGLQTIFGKFHGNEDKKSEKIGATQAHPPGFDSSREHDLLVTMQGTRFRAWMDGVYWGEAQDETRSAGPATLAFLPQMLVRKWRLRSYTDPPRQPLRLVVTWVRMWNHQ